MHRPVAIVTGASSGIGRAAAIALARRGYDLGLTARADVRGLATTCASVRAAGARAASCRLDLATPEAAEGIDALADELGRVDALVNNAGVNHRGAALEVDRDAFRALLDVDLLGPYECARAAARRMIRQGAGGAIVNVTSVLADAPLPGAAAYCAAKAALRMLTAVLAAEWAPHGIRVNAVAPGHTVTPMNFAAPLPRAEDERMVEIPLGRPAEPAEIAAAIAFLASTDAAYATGAQLTVDGGLVLRSGPALLERRRRRTGA